LNIRRDEQESQAPGALMLPYKTYKNLKTTVAKQVQMSKIKAIQHANEETTVCIKAIQHRSSLP